MLSWVEQEKSLIISGLDQYGKTWMEPIRHSDGILKEFFLKQYLQAIKAYKIA